MPRRLTPWLFAALLLVVLGGAWWWAASERDAPLDGRGSDTAAYAASRRDEPSPRVVAAPGIVPFGDAPEPPREVDEEPGRSVHRLSTDDAGLAAAEAEFDRIATQVSVAQWLRKNADAAEKHVDLFCEESKRLQAKVPTTPVPGPRGRDAATYLAVRVDWEGGKAGLLRLPEALHQKVRNLDPGTWPTALDERDWGVLDFGWMHELLTYDHWSLSGDGPQKDPDAVSFFEMNIPNFVGLQSWVKLRLAKALKLRELPQASLEVRHLADLVGTTGTLVSEMIRLNFLRYDRVAWEASGLPIPETGTLPPDLFPLARRVGFASPFFLYPGVPKAVREKALACSPSRCTMIMEGIGAATAMRDAAPDAQETLDWLMAQEPCDPALAKKALAGKPSTLDLVARNWLDSPGAERIVPLPDGGW